jgi:outer membrane murein-binding lipoprotein Lpp
MATAVLLCITTIILAVLAVAGCLARAMRPDRISITIAIPRLLQLKVELASPVDRWQDEPR